MQQDGIRELDSGVRVDRRQHILLEKSSRKTATHWQSIRIPAQSTMCAAEEIAAFGDMSIQ